MSGSIRRFNPVTRSYTKDGQQPPAPPAGIVERTAQGVSMPTPPPATGPAVVTTKPEQRGPTLPPAVEKGQSS